MNSQIKNLGYGLTSLPYDPRDRNFAMGAIFGTPPLPPLKSFRVFEPKKIKNQGETDKCSAYANSYALEAHEGVEINPDYLFAKSKEISGNIEAWGQDLRTACKAPVKYGAIEENTELYNIIAQGRDYSANWRNWGFKYDLSAAVHKQNTFFSVSGRYDLFDNIRANLWDRREKKDAVITGALWRPQWLYLPEGVIPKTQFGRDGYGHAFCFIGQEFIKDEPYLVALLSNGEIGDKGYFYFPREIVNNEMTYGNYMFIDMAKEAVLRKVNAFDRFFRWLKWFYLRP